MRTSVALAHAWYYLLTGIWPLVSMRTFEAVTGPKRDRWLVRTVGALVAVVGAAILRSRGRGDPFLPVASAAAFTAVDVVAVATRTVRPVYLLDAAAEIALIIAWRRALTSTTAGTGSAASQGRNPPEQQVRIGAAARTAR
ncbi:MAG: hypothetical protein ACJ761_10105 [Chloroflexota bacterium]